MQKLGFELKTDGTVYITREGNEVKLQCYSGKWHKFVGSNGYYYGENGGLYSSSSSSCVPDVLDIVAVKIKPQLHVPEGIAVAHHHAESMLEYAKDAATTDKPWLLWETYYYSQWDDLCSNPIWSIQCQYRRKPKQKPMIKIGEFTVPQPMKVKPKLSQQYFVVMMGRKSGMYIWVNDDSDNEFFNNGRCYETKEEADQVGKALVSLLTQ